MRLVLNALGSEGFGAYEVDWKQPMPLGRRVSDPPSGMLVPGFVDLHIHGAFGVDFMSASKQDLEVLCQRLADEGYEGFLPTTVTASLSQVNQVLSSLPDDEMVLGFHLEGPFINRQMAGAQPPGLIADPPDGPSEWDLVLDHPALKVVTLAPELPHATELVRRLSSRGVVVSLGHTNASYDEMRTAYEFGAAHTTHTFNAMRGLHHREAGALGYALLQDGLRCELIYDRKHVCREATKLLLRCKPQDGVVAVSDSTLATGTPPNTTFDFWGQKVVTGKGDVRLEDGTLAGSAVTLLDVFRNLCEDFGPETAVRCCCINPRLALKLTTLPLKWLVFDKQLRLVSQHRMKTSAG